MLIIKGEVMRSIILTFVFVLVTSCGSEGPAGPAGAAGAKGDTGARGISANTIVSETQCHISTSGKYFEYNTVQFSSGDAWTSCSVSDNYSQSSNTEYYRSSQTGSVNFACLATFDWSDGTGSSGWWEFTATSGNRKAVYRDTGSSANGTTITFAGSNCTNPSLF
jgi:hypothetical protein